MEPISPCEEEQEEADNDLRSKCGKFTDADLDELLRDLNEFQNVMPALPGGSAEATNFIKSFFTPHPAQTQCYNFTRLLHDFEEFETNMLPPSQRDPFTPTNHLNSSTTTMTTNKDQNLAREIQDTREMIEEMANDDELAPTSTCVLGLNSNDSAQDVSFDIASGVAGGSGTCSSFEHASNYGCGSSSCLQVASSSMTSFGASSVRYFICSQDSGVKKFAKANTRRKRKYKGVVETEEETASRVERTKTKNREAAAKAHQRKLAHEVHLQTMLLKLRKKNQFLKNMLIFLQGQRITDVPPQPVRRTISGPI